MDNEANNSVTDQKVQEERIMFEAELERQKAEQERLLREKEAARI